MNSVSQTQAVSPSTTVPRNPLMNKAAESHLQTSQAPTWIAAAASIPGRSHLCAGIPCQDASLAGCSPRPHLFVCDGRGSASHSDIGAMAAVAALRAQLDNAAGLFEMVLDGEDAAEAQKLEPCLSQLLYRTAAQEQQRQAERIGANPADFEHTLLMVVCGRRRFLCIQVGDGGIAMKTDGNSVEMLSQQARGEFANTTFFVSHSRKTSWRHVLKDMEGVSGFMAFSDGTAEKLVVNVNNAAAPAIGQIIDRAAAGKFDRKEILGFLTESHWEPQVQDDRSLALLAFSGCSLSKSPQSVLHPPKEMPSGISVSPSVRTISTSSAEGASRISVPQPADVGCQAKVKSLWGRYWDVILVSAAGILIPLVVLGVLGETPPKTARAVAKPAAASASTGKAPYMPPPTGLDKRSNSSAR